ncbi:MAG: hypothetical protein QOI71_3804, partial [Gaiellales bacterium]|nr:hypothetical protein [Gaiellales bacterium]
MESPAEETPDAPVIEPGLAGGDAATEEPVSEEPVAVEEAVAAGEAAASQPVPANEPEA